MSFPLNHRFREAVFEAWAARILLEVLRLRLGGCAFHGGAVRSPSLRMTPLLADATADGRGPVPPSVARVFRKCGRGRRREGGGRMEF